MIVNIEKLSRKETERVDFKFCEEADSISCCDEIYKLASPVEVEGKISRNNKGLYINADVSFTVADKCSRCLETVDIPLEYNIQGFIVNEDDYTEDDYEDYDAFLIDGRSEVDIMDIIAQTIDFNMPHKVLCREDCKGLCPGCGANLNVEDCRCSEKINDEDNIDPRFAKLKELLKNE
ncbi:DUF177 domain-containing protein [Peptacetobacter hominis]|uniref:DUF177 domain-containing protein n=1 Tax=Peptacetobacter hominis TaxID=2743610 RepID=A0A544QVE7_9FIRM|nr:DUF177 domain-containing protein [Peptacetobacter hominis]TQQ84672.1 DUF177 domain-containing protein [Peptacetobacter hominis]